MADGEGEQQMEQDEHEVSFGLGAAAGLGGGRDRSWGGALQVTLPAQLEQDPEDLQRIRWVGEDVRVAWGCREHRGRHCVVLDCLMLRISAALTYRSLSESPPCTPLLLQ